MKLLALQQTFMAEISGDDDLPCSSPGMAIYRNAYRGRLIAALESGYERTRRWVGEAAFERAAAHYVLTHPPHGWTLDLFGAEFSETLAELFAGDPEVAELAWLEWHLQQAFAAPDRPELGASDLANAGLEAEDWDRLILFMAAGFADRAVAHNLAALWPALQSGSEQNPTLDRLNGHRLIVWRQALQSRYRLVPDAEFAVLARLAKGLPLGQAAVDCDAAQLGGWLTGWLSEGLFSAFGLAGRSVPAS